MVGGALIVPQKFIASLLPASKNGEPTSDQQLFARTTELVERLAIEAVIRAERHLGHEPREVSALKCGYDIESRNSQTGGLRFIEVKGRHLDAITVTVNKNEILTAFNQTDAFILALTRVDPARQQVIEWRYVSRPFTREPDFGATSVNYDLRDLLQRDTFMILDL